jgi:hypothetical protein
MRGSHQAAGQFWNLHPELGLILPTTYDSIHRFITREHPIPMSIPPHVREPLEFATQYFAAAYDQFNAGRPELYGQLVRDAFAKAVTALERALVDRLGESPRTNLKVLIAEGRERGWLKLPPELEFPSERAEHTWRLIRETRNDIAHANPAPETFGAATTTMIGFLIQTIENLYSSPDHAGETT